MFNQEIAQQYIDNLIAQHKIKVVQYSVSSCGWANWNTREIKIPHPTNVDRFCVGIHEIKHIIDGNKGNRFQQEFDCDMFALQHAELLGMDTTLWKRRMRWHSLSRIAMAMNRKMLASKIPVYIKEYFSDIDFNTWEGKKIFVGSDKKWEKITVRMNGKLILCNDVVLTN